MRQRGFTLIEMSFVLVIIALIIGGVLVGARIINGAAVSDAIATIQDLRGAVTEFRNKYKYFPGDFPLNGELPGITAGCAAGGDGNGVIDVAESTPIPVLAASHSCALEQLQRDGLIRLAQNPMRMSRVGGGIRIVGRALAAANVPLPVGRQASVNIIEITALPCDAALEIDLKLDDGNLATGDILGSAANCVPGGANDPLPFLGVSL